MELYWIPNSEPDLDHYELDITGDPCKSLKEVYCGVFTVPGTESTYVFNNQNLTQFFWYQFRLRAVNSDGLTSPWSTPLILSSTSVSESARPEASPELRSVPNPFNASTRIEYTLEQGGPVTLRVLDMLGRRVRTLVNGVYGPGTHTVTWLGNSDDGRAIASGVYLLQLTSLKQLHTSRLLLLK